MHLRRNHSGRCARGERREATQQFGSAGGRVERVERTADVVFALTAAYDILIGGLLVAILGGLVCDRGGRQGRQRPDLWRLASGLVVYVVGSLASKPSDPDVLGGWDRRSRGESVSPVRV